MDKVSLLVPAAAVLLSGCAESQFLRPGAAAAIQRDLEQHSDVELVSRHPHLMSRKGGVLEVLGQAFRDEGDCQSGDCTRYRADSVWQGNHVGIEVSYYEEGDYFLVSRGGHIPIGSRPILSPSGRRFFTGHHDDRRWSPYQGASVWEWEPHPRRFRVIDTDLVAFGEFVRWWGDGCIEFTGARGYNVQMRSTRTFWLAEQNGDWQLLENRPATCT